eukprot:gb/GECG01003475.1/.p1 GENE.gb/GECG01003475.1/~~gb/GECG01003475.1/.p1  ORF type:complete len:188 (+),score=35.59 gb/GECG01003475.1/:1-564(+)
MKHQDQYQSLTDTQKYSVDVSSSASRLKAYQKTLNSLCVRHEKEESRDKKELLQRIKEMKAEWTRRHRQQLYTDNVINQKIKAVYVLDGAFMRRSKNKEDEHNRSLEHLRYRMKVLTAEESKLSTQEDNLQKQAHLLNAQVESSETSVQKLQAKCGKVGHEYSQIKEHIRHLDRQIEEKQKECVRAY